MKNNGLINFFNETEKAMRNREARNKCTLTGEADKGTCAHGKNLFLESAHAAYNALVRHGRRTKRCLLSIAGSNLTLELRWPKFFMRLSDSA